MSEQAWTPEPWRMSDETYCGYRYAVAGDGESLNLSKRTGEEWEANQARAVACVNAMQGVSDPAATMNAVRDALSEAAVEIGNYDSPQNPVARRIRDALAQLNGATP